MADPESAQTFGFQAEVKQLLHLMINSLYSNREIFLRELISNASDANDKLRFEALSEPRLLDDGPAELGIRVELDPEAKTLSVADYGIGMSRDEIIEQLGTIAHSGTGRFLDRLTGDQRKDAQLIGQFGVGFYSAFIVADEVEVSSRRAGAPPDQAVSWRSDGRGEFSVAVTTKPERGTTVTLKLKDDASEFLDSARAAALVRKYSDHIAFPIAVSTAGAGEQTEEPVNKATALWARPRSELGDADYVEFYKHLTHDFAEPLVWSHNHVEGKREYTSLVYVPSVAPFDLWNREAPRGLKLYVRRVFITDQATYFLPLYLRFVRGVVDSSDFALNVSREMLQQDPTVNAIKNALTKRVLDLLEKLVKDDPEKYRKFWTQFGSVLKEGLAEDPENRARIAGLLRFESTRSEGLAADRRLADYVADAPAEQDVIYYLIAESAAAARSSPQLEAFRDRDIEVLLMSEPLDEWVMQYLTEHEGKSFKDIGRGKIDLGSGKDGAQIESEPTKEESHLLKRVKRALRDRVDEVRPSKRLKESAACIVLADTDIGFQMREMLKAAGHDVPASLPSLELNLEHPLIKRLESETDGAAFERLAAIVLDEAILADGRPLDDPAAFVKRLNSLLLDLGIAS